MDKHFLETMRSSEYRLKNSNSTVLFYFSPGNLTSTSNQYTPICAFLKEGMELLDFSTARLLLDDIEIESYQNDLNITYSPDEPLSYGCHYVKIIVSTKYGVTEEFGWSFIIEDELVDYNFYYGIPHSHTSYSDGTGIPTEAYEKAKANGLNFLIITDHQGKLVIGNYNYDRSTFIVGSKHPKWEMLKLEASSINSKEDNFIALYGFELSTKFWGHINIINSQSIITKKPSSLDELYSWLCTEENILLSVNHPHRSPRTLPFTHNFDNFVNLYEVGNGSITRQYTRTEENYYRALDDGWHIAAINGQDNHSDDWGDSNNLTAIICKKLSVNTLIDAIRLRRVYSSESKSLKLAVKGNNYWMGSVLNLNIGDRLELHILAEDIKSLIDKIQVVSNGGKIILEKSFDASSKCEWNPYLIIENDYNWYVIKVIHCDGKMGVSSAIFVQDIKI